MKRGYAVTSRVMPRARKASMCSRFLGMDIPANWPGTTHEKFLGNFTRLSTMNKIKIKN